MPRAEKTAKIKACPFCKGKARTYEEGYGYDHKGFVVCACGAQMVCQYDGNSHPVESAVENWNRRAEPPNPPLTLEELRQMDGEPVWVIGVSCINNFQGHWDIFDWNDGHMLFCKSLEEPDLENYDPDGRLGIAGWRAYRRRLEEAER